MDALLSAALQISYFAVFVLTLLAYLRARTPLRRDIALVFSSLGLVFIFQAVGDRIPVPAPILGWIVTFAFLAEPYLILRLVRSAHRVHPVVLRGTLVAFLSSFLLLVVTGPTNRLAIVVLVVYFVGVQSLAAIYFALEARRRVGSSRNRLIVAAAATGLFGMTILVAAAASAARGSAEEAQSGIAFLTRAIALVAAFGYLAAFTPPRWLRRVSQREVAFQHVRGLALLPAGFQPADVWQSLLETASRTTNASEVALVDRLPDGSAVVKQRIRKHAAVIPDQLDERSVEALLAYGRDPSLPDGLRLRDPDPTDTERGATAIAVELDGAAALPQLLVLAFTTMPMFAEDDLELLAVLGAATFRAVDREIAYARLERSEAQLAEAQRQAHVGSWEWEIVANTITWSDELYRIYGLEPQAALRDFDAFLGRVHPDDQERVKAIIERANEDHQAFGFEHRILLDDGDVRSIAAQGTVQTDATGQVVRMVGTGQDISERKSFEQQLSFQAFHDPLTRLANRALFADRVEHATSRRSALVRSLAVMFLDLDDFKNVNDSMGHPAGDELLRIAAGRIQRAVRPSDTVARFGGDEFAVLLEEVSETETYAVADRILHALAQPIVVQSREWTVTASLGIAVRSATQESADELMRNADVAMYRAKAGGKGRREIFDPEMYALVVDRLELRRDLGIAIEQSQLRLHFQPIVDLANLTVVAAEALVRWEHPVRGLLPPGVFISMAEESGLIVPLGRWVLGEACDQAARWTTGPGGMPMRVAVNLSARQLHDPGLVADVEMSLARAKLQADRLTLEITESVLVDDPEAALRRLQALKDLGVRLAIDDFGTGYSSLSYLTRFRVDTLKIDRSFVASLGDRHEGTTVARIIMELGQALGLEVIAEGVERSEQLETLRALGCRVAQGYLFARPMDAKSFNDFLAHGPASPNASTGATRRDRRTRGPFQSAPRDGSAPTGRGPHEVPPISGTPAAVSKTQIHGGTRQTASAANAANATAASARRRMAPVQTGS